MLISHIQSRAKLILDNESRINFDVSIADNNPSPTDFSLIT